MLEKLKLENILPHKAPMILLNKVKDYSLEETHRWIETEVNITSKTLFFDKKKKYIPIWVGIEYMAQSIAALSGIHAKKSKKENPKIGFIIGIKNYQCFSEGFKEGDSLQIKASEIFFVDSLGSFDCTIADKNKKFAAAQINVFQVDSAEEFLVYKKKEKCQNVFL